MGGLSPIHWIIILLVIVLLFGSKKIPELAKGLGQGIKEFKKASSEATKEISEAEKPNASKPDSETKKEG
ncbi:MAG TPA: twin-arginine translocase TatA/TatE family subunit [Chitinivibrionales bacterium]|nr:twin-arginine translocase TatA/TatE family subunit [Chitinivibrionales bacterium]